MPANSESTFEITHYESHLQLLGDVTNNTTVESSHTLVNIPSVRGSEALADKIEVFAEIPDTVLLFILHSNKKDKDETTRILERYPDLRWINSFLPPGYNSELLDFDCDSIEEATAHRKDNDVSTKRNLGLLVAKMLGYGNIFWVDDDMHMEAPDFIRAKSIATNWRTRFNAVGMINTGMPDRSVVCHSGIDSSKQDGFISGGALAYNPSFAKSSLKREHHNFFPNIYNEDWLFLFTWAALGRCARTGQITQGPYDPFAQPGRAESEEFGEIIAEGLFTLLHHSDTDSQLRTKSLHALVGSDYWADFLQARREFILKKLDELSAREDIEQTQKELIAKSLTQALEVNGTIDPDTCQHYVSTWRADSRRWSKLMKNINTTYTLLDDDVLSKSLNGLGLLATSDFVYSPMFRDDVSQNAA